MITVPSLLSGAGSGVQLAGGGRGGGRRRGLPRVPLHRIRERTHQEASRQPRRLHTDQSAAGLLPGEGGEGKNKRCSSVTWSERQRNSRSRVSRSQPVGPNLFPPDFVNALLCWRSWFGGRPAVFVLSGGQQLTWVRALQEVQVQGSLLSVSPSCAPEGVTDAFPFHFFLKNGNWVAHGVIQRNLTSQLNQRLPLFCYFIIFTIFFRCCSVIDKAKTNKNENAGFFVFF